MTSETYLGKHYTGPDGGWYDVVREWKHRVQLRRRGLRTSGVSKISEDKRAMVSPRWREHAIPDKIAKGDVMFCDGERCVITSFQNLGSAGSHLGVTARWGFEEGHTHENLIRFGPKSWLLGEGLRSPFDGELTA